MIFQVTINGVAVEIRQKSLTIAQTMNGRSTATFSIMSADRSYRPPLDAEVLIFVDGTRIFGGLITTPAEAGLHGGVKPNINTRVTASDFHIYADRRAIKEDVPAGSLLSVLQILEPYLAIYGVTLDPAQAVGPTLPALIYDYRRCSDVLNELSTLTAQFGDQFIWQIDQFRVLRMYQPSGISAVFDLVGDTLPEVVGDLTLEKTRETYANRIIVKVPKKTELNRIERFDGDSVADTFALNYSLISFPYGVIRRYDTATGLPSGGETFGVEGTVDGGGNPVQWWYDADTNSIVRNIGAAEAGFTYEIEFNGEKDEIGIAQDDAEIALHGLTEKVVLVEEVPDNTTAQALAEGYLAQSLPIHNVINYKTRIDGLSTGQIQNITVPARDLSGTAIITDIRTREFQHGLIYEVKAVLADDTSLLKGYRDLYKIWRNDLAGSSPGTNTTISTPPGGTMQTGAGPALPFRSNQFNDSGVFGGNPNWLFYKEFTTATIGPGHTPAGANNFLNGRGHTVLNP